METVIIACHTISDEVNMAINETGCRYPVLWINSGLHIDPAKLKNRLQEELDHIDNVERVLLAFGYCGNAVLGLKAKNYQLIFPRTDDCITLLLGSCAIRKEISDEMNTYFLTKGWLDHEKNIWAEYQDTVKRMGKARADRVYGIMLKHYERLGVIETGAYNIDELIKTTEIISRELKLKHQVIPGTLDYIKKLFTGQWDSDFIIIKPGEEITMNHIYDGSAAYKSNLFLA